jgi:hypothetical protein
MTTIDQQILAIKAYLSMRMYNVVSEHTFAKLDAEIDRLDALSREYVILKA